MDTQETLETLGTQDKKTNLKHNTTQKTKERSSTDPLKYILHNNISKQDETSYTTQEKKIKSTKQTQQTNK